MVRRSAGGVVGLRGTRLLLSQGALGGPRASAPDVQVTLGHSSLQVTERYSRAREGVALRAGAVLDQAHGGGTGEGAGAKRKGTLAAEMAQEWPKLSTSGGGARRQAGESLIRRDFRWWLRRASIP